MLTVRDFGQIAWVTQFWLVLSSRREERSQSVASDWRKTEKESSAQESIHAITFDTCQVEERLEFPRFSP